MEPLQKKEMLFEKNNSSCTADWVRNGWDMLDELWRKWWNKVKNGFWFWNNSKKSEGDCERFWLVHVETEILGTEWIVIFRHFTAMWGAVFWMDFSGKLCIYKCCNLCYTRTYRFHLPIDSRWKKRGSIRVLVKVPVNSKAAVGSICTDRLLGYEV
mgnify:CR=1 FL=1